MSEPRGTVLLRGWEISRRLAGRLVMIFVLPCLSLWMVGAVCFSVFPSGLPRVIGAGVIGLSILLVLALVESRWKVIGLVGGLFLIVFGGWSLIPASNDRDWPLPVMVLPDAEISSDGGEVRVSNVRNFHYRSRDDFDVAYYDATYDLSGVRGVDFVVSYWGNEAIAHTFLSFEFEGGQRVAVSVEIRPEVGESFHPLAGLFKQYEIIYVVGDERDVIGVRTNHRMEDTYLYRSRATPEQARAIFVDVMRRVGELADEPAFYGTVGANCTTSMVEHVNTALERKVPFSGKLLFNGFSDKLAYERGNLETVLPFPDLKQACYISGAARRLGDGEGFSEALRERIAERVEAAKGGE
ncbi:MAG: DUF4105 domain-containing protein [Verrucomicrobiales bacterium]|nr:DUF4105 domain-containing protein [Verrucomicrobiales bacterium]